MPTIEELRGVCQPHRTDSEGKQRLAGLLWNRIFSRHVSIYLTSFFVRRQISANQVSGLMVIAGAGAFWAALPHNPYLNFLSLVLLLLFFILDCSDGEVARWTRQVSKRGVVLDFQAHAVSNIPLLSGAAIHAALLHRSYGYAMLACATLLAALWGYCFKLTGQAVMGIGVHKAMDGDVLFRRKGLLRAVRFLQVALSDTAIAPIVVVCLLIASHAYPPALTAGVVYGLLSASYFCLWHLVSTYMKAVRLDRG